MKKKFQNYNMSSPNITTSLVYHAVSNSWPIWSSSGCFYSCK